MPPGLPTQLSRRGDEISYLEWQLANASAVCGWLPVGVPFGPSWPRSAYSSRGVSLVRVTDGAGPVTGMLHLRGRASISSAWTAVADVLATPLANDRAYADGFVVTLHNDARGVDAICGAGACLAYTSAGAGPQTGVSGCGTYDCSCAAVAPSVAFAAHVYRGCVRIGVGGVFAAADACSTPNFFLGGEQTLTAVFSYSPGGHGASAALSGGLFMADGSPLPNTQVSFNLTAPLETILRAPDGTALFGVGAAGGYLNTDWTLAAVGWFSRAPLIIYRLTPSPSSSSPPGTLPTRPHGSIALPLFCAAGAAALVAAGATIVARRRASFFASRLMRARVNDFGKGARRVSVPVPTAYGYEIRLGDLHASDSDAIDTPLITAAVGSAASSH